MSDIFEPLRQKNAELLTRLDNGEDVRGIVREILIAQFTVLNELRLEKSVDDLRFTVDDGDAL